RSGSADGESWTFRFLLGGRLRRIFLVGQPDETDEPQTKPQHGADNDPPGRPTEAAVEHQPDPDGYDHLPPYLGAAQGGARGAAVGGIRDHVLLRNPAFESIVHRAKVFSGQGEERQPLECEIFHEVGRGGRFYPVCPVAPGSPVLSCSQEFMLTTPPSGDYFQK